MAFTIESTEEKSAVSRSSAYKARSAGKTLSPYPKQGRRKQSQENAKTTKTHRGNFFLIVRDDMGSGIECQV